MNKKSYTNKYGTKVGPYDRRVSSFPNSYIIYRMVNGERRLCKITRKNGKEYMHVLDNQRKAKPITFAEAKKHFEKLPEYRQEVDKRFRAKHTFEKEGVTSSYITKTGSSRYDVEGLDTPLEKFTEKESKLQKPSKKEYENAEEKLSKATKRFFNKDEITDVKEDLVIEIEDRPVILTYDRIAILTTPEMFEGTRIDRIGKNDKTVIKELPEEFFVDSGGDRHFCDKNNLNYYDLEKVEKIVKKMDKDSLEIYYGNDVDNDGFSPLIIRDKNFVYAIAPQMSEKHKAKSYEKDIKETKQQIELVRKQKEEIRSQINEAKDPKKIAELQDSMQDKNIELNNLDFSLNALESNLEDTNPNEVLFDIKSNAEEYKKLKDMTKEELIILGDIEPKEAPSWKGKLIYKVLEKQKDKDYLKRKKELEDTLKLKGKIQGIWKGEKDTLMGAGIINEDNISFITTTEEFNNSQHYNLYKDKYNEINYPKSSLAYEDDDFYLVSPDKDVLYKYDLVSDALKDLKDPKIFYAEDTPLLIKGKDRSMVIAPRMIEDEVDEIIPVNDYERLSKLKKKDLAIKSDPSYKTQKVTGQKDYWIKEAYRSEMKKREEKNPNRYYMTSRPVMIGTVPDVNESITHENWKPSKENNYRHGYIEYPNSLSFEQIWRYELEPSDPIEKANYTFWKKEDKDPKKAEKLKNTYLSMSKEELEEYIDRDPLCRHALILKEEAK